MADYLEDLYNPVSTPGATPIGSFDQTTQAMTKNLSGVDPNAPAPQLPIGTGNTMYKGPMFGQEDIGNVSGVVGTQEDPKTAFIPEVAKTDEEIRKEQNKEAGGAALSGAAKGAKLGATLGSVVPGLGTAAGRLIGGAAGAAIGFFGNKKKNK